MLASTVHRPYIEDMVLDSAVPDLDPRARQLLRALIGQYIHHGTPVGSQTLAKCAGLDISPATIRNILGDLEEIGLLVSPHTSAGRIPTAQGYRVFVDSLLQVNTLHEREITRLREGLPKDAPTSDLLTGAGELLSAMSHFVGVVSAPKRNNETFKHIEFVGLAPDEILAVVVFPDLEVQNRVIRTETHFDPQTLEQISNYLNRNFAGLPLQNIRKTLVAELRQARDDVEEWMQRALELAELAVRNHDQPALELYVAGQINLMAVEDLNDMARLRGVFETFQRKRDMLQLLERTLHSEGVRIFIGEETGLAPMEAMSVVSTPYSGADGRVLGVLGVIGPSRMAYSNVIPLVQATAQVLGERMGAR